jgi:hypothetical protein
MAIPYPGNVPSNVGKDAKYSVAREDGEFVVKLLYRMSARERELLTNDEHPALVDMVNAVKTEHNGVPGGAFYINEYHDTLLSNDMQVATVKTDAFTIHENNLARTK